METEKLDTENLRAIVEFGLYENCMKGRPGYKESVRPNHWIPGRRYTFMGKIEFQDREWLRPGETCHAKGSYIIASQDKEFITSGYAWHVCEACKVVGFARVVEVTDT